MKSNKLYDKALMIAESQYNCSSYPLQELQQARATLIQSLNSISTRLAKRLKRVENEQDSFFKSYAAAQVQYAATSSRSSDTMQHSDSTIQPANHTVIQPQSLLKKRKNHQVEISRERFKTDNYCLERGEDELKHVEKKIEEARLIDIYSCDYCGTNKIDKMIMSQHLVSSGHISASLYDAQLRATTKDTNNKYGKEVDAIEYKLISIKTMQAVINHQLKAVDREFIVVCPQCFDTFADIFQCGIHYRNFHGGLNGTYSICPVKKLNPIVISVDSVCMFCHISFKNHLKLHEHWRTNSDHIQPLKTFQHALQSSGIQPVSTNIAIPLTYFNNDLTIPSFFSKSLSTTFLIFSCTICSLAFYGNFIACKMHVLSNKKHREFVLRNGRKAFEVFARVVLPPIFCADLVPFAEDFHCAQKETGLQREIKMLRATAQHHRTFGMVRGKLKKIRHEVKRLRTL